MPIIPQLSDQGQRVRTEALPGARVSTEIPLDALGGGASSERFSQAGEAAVGTFQKIAVEQKNQADQAAHLQADTELAKQTNQIQIGLSNMKGQAAFNADKVVGDQFNQAAQKISEGLSNPQQKAAFQRSVAQRGMELNKVASVHMNSERNNFEEQNWQNGIQENLTGAVINAGDDQIIQQNQERIAGITADMAQRRGLNPQLAFMNAISPFHRDVIDARLESGNTEGARAYFEKNKTQMNANDIKNSSTSLAGQEVINNGNKVFDEMLNTKGVFNSDRTLNEQKIMDQFERKDGISDKQWEAEQNFIQHKVSEYNVNENKKQQQLERSFLNEAYQMQKQGVPLSKAMSLVPKYGVDASDQAQKAQQIGKIYSPPTDSNPQVYMNLWERVQSGQATKDDIQKAYQANQVNTTDWESLTKMTYDQRINGTNPQMKLSNERIKILADEHFGRTSSDNKDKFLYTVNQMGEGKSPEEKYKIANDQLKSDPSTGMWGMFQNKQYEQAYKQSDAQTLGMGVVHDTIGADATKAIQSQIYRATGKKAGIAEINAYAEDLGGLENVKVGTPANNAINSLVQRNLKPTVDNVNAVLKKYPDGKF